MSARDVIIAETLAGSAHLTKLLEEYWTVEAMLWQCLPWYQRLLRRGLRWLP